MLKKILILALSSFLITGCSWMRVFTTEEIGDNESLVCKIPYEFQQPTPIKMQDVKFYVLTRDIMQEIIEGNPNDLPVVFYALSVDGYESMSYNMLEINRYLEANNILIKSIRDYYKKEETSEESEN